MSKEIQIHPKIWFAKHSSRGDLSFMCHHEDDDKFQKRRRTGMSWAGDGCTEQIVENVPVGGFTVGDTVTRWETERSYFRVMDPRGFELEISTGNLECLMRDLTIEKGEIKSKCLWGRQGQRNVLLSIESEPYKASRDMTKIDMKVKVPIRDLKVGDEVMFKTLKTAIYAGRFIVTGYYTRWGRTVEQVFPARHFFLTKSNYSNKLAYNSPTNPHIIKVLSHGNDIGDCSVEQEWNDGKGYDLYWNIEHPYPSYKQHLSRAQIEEIGRENLDRMVSHPWGEGRDAYGVVSVVQA